MFHKRAIKPLHKHKQLPDTIRNSSNRNINNELKQNEVYIRAHQAIVEIRILYSGYARGKKH